MPQDHDIFVLRLPMERLDAAAAPEFKARLSEEISEDMRLIIVDFSEVAFVDSTGLGAIVSLLKMMPRDGKLAVAGLNSSTLRLFQLTRLDRVFEIFDDVEEARVALSK